MSDIVQLKTAEEIRDDILAEIESNTGISDENLGSVARTFAYAVATEIDEFYYQLYKATRAFYIKTSTGTALDNRGSDYGLTRLAAAKAVGVARFTCSAATTINSGSQVAVPATSTHDEIVFEAVETVVVAAPGTADVRIQALVAGEDGNVASSSITYLKQSISNVTGVTNPAATVLGSDEEDDDEFRDRIIRTLQGLSRGTIPAILNGAIDFALQEVTLAVALPAGQNYIEVAEDLNLYPFSAIANTYLSIDDNTEVVYYTGIDTSVTPHRFTGVTRAQLDGSTPTVDAAHEVGAKVKEHIPTGRGYRVTSASLNEYHGYVNVYIDDGTVSGPVSYLVDLVQKRLRGDGTDRDPGYRGAGISLYVYARSVILVDVTITVVVEPDYDATEVKDDVESAITDFLNGHKVDQDVYAYQIAEVAMGVQGVRTITALDVDGVTFDGTSAADIAVNATSVARANTITVS